MNKSILKHEIRSMRWMLLLSVLVSLFLTIMFSMSLNNVYERMFSYGIQGNQALIQRSLRDISQTILALFTILSIIQIFMQFRSEKNQEIGRFLKSLPVRKEEFFKVKLVSGVVNLTLAFIVLAIGTIIVRNNNMFWIKDIYSISTISAPFIQVDGVASLLKEIGLIYLVVLSFYTFLFMIQYTFTNVVGGIVTGILVWLSPAFIIISSIFTLERFISIPISGRINMFAEWLLPWAYPLDYDYNTLFANLNGWDLGGISIIEKLGIKYIICLGLILFNMIISYKFNKTSKIEDENKIIAFKSTRNIFKLGVTICSGLLISTILSGILMIRISNIIYILFMLLGGSIGYFISRRITQVGN